MIENGILRVEVDLHGGALCSVFDKRSGKELLWQGTPNSWQNHDVVIFPFVARLKDKTYTADGKEYSMENHGLARYSDFRVLRQAKDSLVVGFESTNDSLERYPFEFGFSVTYSLCDNSLSIKYRVENRGSAPMYFAVGGHAAYNIDCTEGKDADDMSGNSVEFPDSQTVTRFVLDRDGALIVGETEPYALKAVPLDKSVFKEHKTLIYGGGFERIRLKKKSGGSIDYDMCGVPYLGIWSHETRGGYVCVEPWWGLPDFKDCDRELKNKRGINRLEKNSVFECGYKTTYNQAEVEYD